MIRVRESFEVCADEKNRRSITEAMLRDYPFLTCRQVGYSNLSRPIEALCLGNEHEQVLYCGGFHGMEWITSLLLFKFLNNVCTAIERGDTIRDLKIGRFLRRRGLIIIPCVNPDGVEIAINGSCSAGKYKTLVDKACKGDCSRWQANARGVDINHNFNADWDDVRRREVEAGINGPSPTKFGGNVPESEIETKALTDFCRRNNIRHALAFHSQGEEIYWNYGKNTPKRSELMAKIMSQLSGYKMSVPTGTAVGGGFKDWFIDELKKPAFTIEVGKGTNPLDISQLNIIYEKLEEMMTVCTIM